ncbi:MAG: beta-N-acetylhexosaminidase [Odoribacteraceae bacterium]|jgi:hexosaminidase|nr:beta-N-acetylhexosaminidase [Odoribacteraceae bacterium]
MKKFYILFLIAMNGLLVASCNAGVNEVNIIPRPAALQVMPGSFSLTPKTVINVVAGTDELLPACRFFSALVERSLGIPLEITRGKARGKAINLTVDASLGEEAYTLIARKKSVDITAGSARGIFYAFQTLRQLLPAGVESGEAAPSISIQNVAIEDEPRLAYRGMMLDVARHFFPVEDVKTYIDMLALHKINRFHWHLTDDQGWRIEIKKYPRLTEIGSTRPETVIGKNTGNYDGIPHGGFYTREQIQEVVQYAADRFITVIPEIELPGHALAALAAYPELGCTGGPYNVATWWGVFNEVFCAGNEQTFAFLEGVLEEVIPLFPSEYIHIGGDECPKVRWKACRKCQARIKAEGLADEHELQSYFVQRMERFLNARGKKIIGWDEILEGGISKTATVMSWRGTKGGIEAAKLGNRVVMSPNSHAYFDYYQSKDTKNEPYAIGGFVPLSKVYSLDPTEGLDEQEASMIYGAQANLWTEYISDIRHVQYMTLPRMAALAEVAWTPQSLREYNDFLKRAIVLTNRYKSLGYNFATHLFNQDQ